MDGEQISAADAAYFGVDAVQEAGFTVAEPAADAPSSENPPDPAPAATETSETAPEAASEPAKPAEKGPQMVPLAALQEERRERQALKAEIEALKAQLAPKPAEQPKPPTADEDPIAALKATQERQQQLEQRIQAQQQAAAVQARIQQAEQAFKASTPDYEDAIQHLSQNRGDFYAAIGVTDPTVRQQLVEQEARQLVAHALQSGANPAEVAYKLAKQVGYAPKAAAVPAEQKLAMLEKGQAAAKSLSGGGGAPKGQLTAEDLASLSPEEFEKISDAEFRKAFGA